MRLKLDENIGRRGLALLKSEGHDVMTVREQGLGGTSDERLFEVCRDEERALVTLDRDFGQVMRFPPENSAGIVVLDQGPRATPGAVLDRSTMKPPLTRPKIVPVTRSVLLNARSSWVHASSRRAFSRLRLTIPSLSS